MNFNATENFESENASSENDNFLSFFEEKSLENDVVNASTIAVRPPDGRVLEVRANVKITSRYKKVNVAYCEPTTYKKAISGPVAEQWKLVNEQELLEN